MKQAVIKWKLSNFDVSQFVMNGTRPTYTTALGALFAGDCVQVLRSVRTSVVDTVFADPPFNLGKEYRENTDDDLPDHEYLEWCRRG